MFTGTRYILFSLLAVLSLGSTAMAQKKVAELTLVYDAVIGEEGEGGKLAETGKAVATFYIKGSLSRSEMSSGTASFTAIHDAKTGHGVMLQEISGQKLLIRMTTENWQDKNRQYENISFANTAETRHIAGYSCIKAVASMKDGSTFTVYYTKDIVPENTAYNAPFKNLPGLPLEYELSQGGLKIRYTVSKINMNPVPASKFDIPKSGYRELSYEESRKLGIGK